MNTKSLACGVLFLLTALLCGPGVAVADTSPYENALNAGLIQEKEGKCAEARAEFEKALAVEGLTPDQTGQALVRIGAAFIQEKKIQDGIAALDKARALTGISNPTRIEANLLYGHTYLDYPGVLPQARDAFAQCLEFPDITAKQKTTAQEGLV